MLKFPSLVLVPMTKTVLLGLTLMTVLAMTVVFPAVAEAITEIKKTEVKVKKGDLKKLKFKLQDKVPTGAFGGYAILTDASPTAEYDGTAIAITSHAGFYDSERQSPPTLPPIIQFGGPAALCAAGDSGCGGEWHVHVVEAVANTGCASGLQVGELTFDDPSEKLKIKAKALVAKKIELGKEVYTAALAGGDNIFDAGTIPGTDGLAFDLTPKFLDDEDPTTLQYVCIGPLTTTLPPPPDF